MLSSIIQHAMLSITYASLLCYCQIRFNSNLTMYLLYDRFIQQTKQQQIQLYNHKHQPYLQRTQPTIQQPTHPTPQPPRLKHPHPPLTKPTPTSNTQLIQERPLKGNQHYPVPQQPQHRLQQNVKERTMPKAGRLRERKNQVNPSQQAQFLRENVENNQEVLNPHKMPDKPINFNKLNMQELEQFQEIQLIQCPENCGRKFKPQALEKHIKMCQKKEKKRNVFKVKVVDEEAEQLKRQQPMVVEEKKHKTAKWKRQSAQLRNIAKVSKGDRSEVMEQVDDRVQCGGCGRKFNEQAAKKHIPSCLSRNKMKK